VTFLWKIGELNFCGDVDFVSQGILWLFGVDFFIQLMYIYTYRVIGDL